MAVEINKWTPPRKSGMSAPNMLSCYNYFIPIVGDGKRKAHINWSMVIPEKAATVTGTTLRTILALCRRTLGKERYRYAIA